MIAGARPAKRGEALEESPDTYRQWGGKGSGRKPIDSNVEVRTVTPRGASFTGGPHLKLVGLIRL